MGLSIQTIDCEYIRARFAAAYLLVDEGRAAFIDNNTSHSVPLLLQALAARGLRPDDVEHVIITHVHLDHAGGTSRLMQACPRARLLAHPRAATHMIDPSKLVGSAREVYGVAAFDRLYGAIEPIAESRVQMMGDDESIALGGTSLRFLHTRGHANHHFCVEARGSEHVIFTGDAFGLAYPDVQPPGGGLMIFPSTSPTDFDAELARASVRRIVATGARVAYPTHFGAVTDLSGAEAQLGSWLDFSEALLADAIASPEPDAALDAFCESRVREHMKRELERRGLRLEGAVAELLQMDLQLNGAGLAHVARKRRARGADGVDRAYGAGEPDRA